MTLAADEIAARRQLKRQLNAWRLISILIVVGALIASAAAVMGVTRERIAVIPIQGVIWGDPALIEALERVTEEAAVKAVILDINSPGGGTAASEELFEAIRNLAAVKPVAATMRDLAASGGYIAAIGADHIVARRNTITGSIGVIFQSLEMSKLLETVGVSVEDVATGPLKAEPSPYRPMSPEARKALQSLVNDSFDWFVGLVAERRQLPREEVLRLADGRVYTGAQALSAKLVDALGGEEVAVAWLTREKGIDPDLPVETESLDPLPLDFADMLAGLPARVLKKALQSEPLTLDGLVSVWHPPRE